MAALPLFVFALAGYMVRAAYAWENMSSGQVGYLPQAKQWNAHTDNIKISETPVRYNRVYWSSLPLLPRIEAVLAWDWYRGKQL